MPACPFYFLNPKKIADNINRIFARFVWRSNKDKHPIFWRRREIIELPRAMGGLGIRNVRAFNIALLAKQVVRLHERKDLLISKVVSTKYKGTPFELGLQSRKIGRVT